MGATGSWCCAKQQQGKNDPVKVDAGYRSDDCEAEQAGIEATGAFTQPKEESFTKPPKIEPPKEDELAERRRAETKKRIGRRSSTEHASIGEEHLHLHKRPREKGLATIRLLKEGMKKDRVCALLEERELDAILETMEYYEFGEDDLVVRQGQAGDTFFVTQTGTLEVSVNGVALNKLAAGNAFGGLALLYNCPRTATVKALDNCGVWGANGVTFHKVLQENSLRHYSENRKFLDSIRLFDGLDGRQKDRMGESFFTEVFEAGSRVVTQGDSVSVIYFVKKGELTCLQGGSVKADTGKYVGGTETSRLGAGDCYGERALMEHVVAQETVVSVGRCELLCISVRELKDVLGNEMGQALERNFILQGLKKSPVISQFSSTQQYEMSKHMLVVQLQPNQKVEEGLRFCIVIEGRIAGGSARSPVSFERGQSYEDGSIGHDDMARTSKSMVSQENSQSIAVGKTASLGGNHFTKEALSNLTASEKGAKIAVLTEEGLASALREMGLSTIGSAEEAQDFTRKMISAKKVHIFRHLSQEQTNKLVKSFVLHKYSRSAQVIKQGEPGTTFFVIASGEVRVLINGEMKRTLGKNAYFGERALLFDEPRTATVEVSSTEAELWAVEKSTFSQIVKGNMQQELMHRIRLQDTNVTMKDLKCVKVIGAGAAGVVRLVEHKKTQTRYALKRVTKTKGKVPEEVRRECALLKENDHPFIMALVKIFETKKSVYMLTELITGGELHAAIRMIPTVLTRAQAQFYTGSLVVVLEELCDRNIVYRDLKPENVMLDQQGYLKLIDFGIAKKLDEGKMRTFTMIGTPHYMAPEVMKGHGYGTEVDLWSLGVMLFEFVCGYLPFADELDDPTEVCTAVVKEPLTFPPRYRDEPGKKLMQALLTRQPKKRLGAGLNGYEDVKSASFFKAGHDKSSVFNKILGRELDPPVVPKGEVYCDPEEVKMVLSDKDELGG